jgi:hypothetical protein
LTQWHFAVPNELELTSPEKSDEKQLSEFKLLSKLEYVIVIVIMVMVVVVIV